VAIRLTIRLRTRFLILRIGYTFRRLIGLLRAAPLTKRLADLLPVVRKTIQIAYGMALLAEAMHLVLVTEINLHVKRLHIIPAVVEIM
jgi:hypothetical protein